MVSGFPLRRIRNQFLRFIGCICMTSTSDQCSTHNSSRHRVFPSRLTHRGDGRYHRPDRCGGFETGTLSLYSLVVTDPKEMGLHLPPLAQPCEMPMEPQESHAGCVGARRLICLDLEAAFNCSLVTACLSDQNLKLELIAQSDKSSWHLDRRD
jgi:hypothetical protein